MRFPLFCLVTSFFSISKILGFPTTAFLLHMMNEFDTNDEMGVFLICDWQQVGFKLLSQQHPCAVHLIAGWGGGDTLFFFLNKDSLGKACLLREALGLLVTPELTALK